MDKKGKTKKDTETTAITLDHIEAVITSRQVILDQIREMVKTYQATVIPALLMARAASKQYSGMVKIYADLIQENKAVWKQIETMVKTYSDLQDRYKWMDQLPSDIASISERIVSVPPHTHRQQLNIIETKIDAILQILSGETITQTDIEKAKKLKKELEDSLMYV